eukprot:gnl/Hemi2/22148_TR7380_c0_g1_i1.p1 gnl/Hemi2/22148_TR7380_c0_g1~~gnl/Hemi2/22148_TR7380_c0_g1_i1.p1  ORF type:complete len:439 (+),score=123.90 gnl/Hemi2/22148_TR7380_c0_g1_i1:83-1399(+)
MEVSVQPSDPEISLAPRKRPEGSAHSQHSQGSNATKSSNFDTKSEGGDEKGILLPSAECFWISGLLAEAVDKLSLVCQLMPGESDKTSMQRLVADEVNALIEEQQHLGPVFEKLLSAHRQKDHVINKDAVKNIVEVVNRSTCAMNLSLQDTARFTMSLQKVHQETRNLFDFLATLIERMAQTKLTSGLSFDWFVSQVEDEIQHLEEVAANEEEKEVVISVTEWQEQIEKEKRERRIEVLEKNAIIKKLQDSLKNNKLQATSSAKLFDKDAKGKLESARRAHDTGVHKKKEKIAFLERCIALEERKCQELRAYMQRKAAGMNAGSSAWQSKFEEDCKRLNDQTNTVRNAEERDSTLVSQKEKDVKLWSTERDAREAEKRRKAENLRLANWEAHRRESAAVLIQWFWRRHRCKRRRPRPPRKGKKGGGKRAASKSPRRKR